MGIIFENQKDYNKSVLWLAESLCQATKENFNSNVNKVDILKHYAYSLHKNGNETMASQIMLEIFELTKNHESFYRYVKSYPTYTYKSNETEFLRPFYSSSVHIREMYKLLCNGKNNSVSDVIKILVFLLFMKILL